jgi:fatty-acyl-CoA synthase
MAHDAVDTSIGFLLDAFDRHHDRIAIRHQADEWTYGTLRDRIYRMARALRAHGLDRGDVVALWTGNVSETYVLRYAAGVLGCCTVVLYDQLPVDQVAEMLRTAGAAALVLPADDGTDRAADLAEHLPKLLMLALGPHPAGLPDLAAAAAVESADPLPIEARPEDTAALRLTGGSTGAPKWIPFAHRTPGYFAPAALTAWHDQVQLLCTPIGHLAGTLSEVLLAAGGRVVLHREFDAGRVLAAIEAERVTFLWLAANLLPALVEHPAVGSTDTSSLRSIMLGGWASSVRHVARALEFFGPIIGQGYGANEVGQITILSAKEHLRPELLSTVGRPVPGVEVSIRDAAGEPVPAGVTGEIWVRGPNLMTGYYQGPEQTEQVMRDGGWFVTGDLGFLSEEGYLSVVGRSKEVITGALGGHIYPEAVENLLLAREDVQDAMVTAVHDGAGDLVCAAVVPAPGKTVSASVITEWVRQQRGDAYAPDVVLVLPELPTTGSAKPDRAALRDLVRAHREPAGQPRS